MSGSVWSSPDVEQVARLVRDRTGLVFPPNRRETAESGIRRSMQRLGLAEPARYAEALREGGAVLDDLVAELTVGETYFFREPGQLEFVRREVLPVLAARGAGRQAIRAWSAGCASGEEPYSLAIILVEDGLAGRARLLGTEISRPRLAAARRGQYGRWSLRGMPDEKIERYFERVGKRFSLDPAIRRMVEFRYLNLAEDLYPAASTGIWGMDLILCRNVLIYFDRDTVQRVARRLLDSLSEGGWLLLGASDPMLTDLVPCEVVTTGAGLAYRRPSRRMPAAGSVEPPAPAAPNELDARPLETPLETPFEPPSVRLPESRAPRSTPVAPASDAAASGSSDALERTATFYARREYESAVGAAQEAVARDPDDVRSWSYLVRALANLGRLAEAGIACAAALERHRMSAELVYLHALLVAESGRTAEAAAAARRALYLDRDMVVAHLALGNSLARQGDSDGARRAFANADELLAAMAPETIVPASDGETAFRLRQIARAQRALLGGAAA
ncbi:MAG: CheR family methyltransferase [Gemmatimonadaceae bacterium]